MADTEEEIEDVENTGTGDVDGILIIVFLVGVGAIILAFVFDPKAIAQQGLGPVGGITNLFSSIFNGIATAITDFFNAIGKWIQNSI